MLQKLKITTYVFILCLFGLTLITVTPVLALTCMPGGYYKETRTPCDPAKLGLPTPRNSDLGQKQQRSVGRILQKKQKNYDEQQIQRLQQEIDNLKNDLLFLCEIVPNMTFNVPLPYASDFPGTDCGRQSNQGACIRAANRQIRPICIPIRCALSPTPSISEFCR